MASKILPISKDTHLYFYFLLVFSLIFPYSKIRWLLQNPPQILMFLKSLLPCFYSFILLDSICQCMVVICSQCHVVGKYYAINQSNFFQYFFFSVKTKLVVETIAFGNDNNSCSKTESKY